MSIKEIITMAHNYGCLYERTLSEVYSEETLLKDLKEQLTLTDVVGQSEQLKALEDLKDFAYDNCQLHNSDRLAEIMERL